MKFKLNCIVDKEKFHIEKCREYGDQRVNDRERFWKNVDIVNALIDTVLTYQDEETRLFEYSDTKILDIQMTFNELKIETKNKIYTFSSK